MPNNPSPALVLRDDDREILESWTRSTTNKAGLVQRVRIIFLAAEGMANAHIAEAVGTTTTSVGKWRNRYRDAGVGGLDDAARSGRPKQVSDLHVVYATLSRPPKKYGVTHWSSHLLGQHLGLGNATVARAWRAYGVQPLEGRDVQVLHRSRVGRQGHRRCRTVSGRPGQRDRAVCR